jgi:hypothetical protein
MVQYEGTSRTFPRRTEYNHEDSVRMGGLQTEISNRSFANTK